MIRFRPPTAADVSGVYRRLAQGRPLDELLTFTAGIANELLAENSSSSSFAITRSSDILMRRLLFDEAYSDLIAINRPASGMTRTQADQLLRVIEAYERMLPASDARRTGIAGSYFNLRFLAPEQALSEGDLIIVLRLFPSFRPEIKLRIATEFVESLRPHLRTRFPELLNLYSQTSSSLPAELRQRCVTMLQETINQRDFSLRIQNGTMGQIENLLGRDAAQ